MYRAGQKWFAKARQTPYPLSTAIGYSTPRRRDCAMTLSMFPSKSNSGVWTPTTVSPSSRYLAAQARRYGSVRSQLTQVYVQKSTSTTRPRRPSGVKGSELSHPVAPSNDGRRPSTGSATSSPARRWTIERIRPRLPGASDARSLDPVSSDIWLSFGADARVLDGRQDAVRA